MPIITLAQGCAHPHKKGEGSALGSMQMTICDEIRTWQPTCGSESLSRSFRPIWLRLVRNTAAILMGIAAFFMSFEAARAAPGTAGALTRPDDAKSGSLLIK